MSQVTLESLLNPELPKPDKVEITIDQFRSVCGTFSNIMKTEPYSDESILELENELMFKLGKLTKDILKTTGNLIIGDFEVPNKEKLIELTNKWKNTVAAEEDKCKYIVIEADGDDFTLVNSSDEIFVYSGETKQTNPDDTNVVTHICKHVFAKIVGKEYDY